MFLSSLIVLNWRFPLIMCYIKLWSKQFFISIITALRKILENPISDELICWPFKKIFNRQFHQMIKQDFTDEIMEAYIMCLLEKLVCKFVFTEISLNVKMVNIQRQKLLWFKILNLSFTFLETQCWIFVNVHPFICHHGSQIRDKWA